MAQLSVLSPSNPNKQTTTTLPVHIYIRLPRRTITNKTLWFRTEARYSRGAAETALLKYAKEINGKLEVHVVGPVYVVERKWVGDFGTAPC